jgi:hypothetical protein
MVVMMVVTHAVTVNLIGLHTDQNAVIQLGVSMVLIVLRLKQIITGIAQDVTVLVMLIQSVVMVHVMVMKHMKPVQMIVCLQVNVQKDKYLIVMAQVIASQKPGLVMAYAMVQIRTGVLT